MRCAAAEIASALRDDIDTRAPSAARARATANPNPRLAPATIATLFVKPKSMDLPLTSPVQYPIERQQSRCVQLRAGPADGAGAQRPAPPQDFFADGLPD